MDNQQWVPLLQFAARKGISMSTLRRRIKSNKIKYQLRNGRYFILDDVDAMMDPEQQKIIYELKEEIADLKTLVRVLESLDS